MSVVLIGLDFGTAVTRAVSWTPDDRWPEQVVTVPSLALARPEGQRVGAEALAEAAAHPGALICGIKRLLERRIDDDVARSVAARAGAALEQPGTRLELRTPADTTIAVDGAIAALLHQAAARAAEGNPGQRLAVITIPEWYDGPQQGALRRAAQHAGLQVLRFIGDMAAMGLWLARSDSSSRTFALINAGAGGTCVTIASVDHQALYLAASVSDRRCGGDDVTASLVDAVLAEAPDRSPSAREAIRQVVEVHRPLLVGQEQIELTVELPPQASPFSFLLEQSQLAPAMAVLHKSIAKTCEEALADAELEPEDIDQVFATGGMSLFPSVVEQIAASFGREVQHDPAFDWYPVRGAAYEAAILANEIAGPLVLDGQSTGRMVLQTVS